MTPLTDIIRAEIRQNGPIGFDRYMELCLSHPEHGYYRKQQVFGAEGDFTTAPEISQMFGELLGLWLVHMWVEIGAPAHFALVELGPGRGTLMADILRVAKMQPAFLESAEVFLVESSEKLRKTQQEALNGVNLTYLEDLSDLPDLPLILVANEFFDALPIKQFVKNDFGWQERRIDDSFQISLSETFEQPDLDKRFTGVPTGTNVEICPAAEVLSDVITKTIMAKGGIALIVDYGDFDGVGDTFQAVQRHKATSPFNAPGEADLTAHVRFKDLVRNGVYHNFTTQGEFLTRLGIDTRRDALERSSRRSMQAEQNRLVGVSEMGNLFKVLSLSSLPLNSAPGFEE